jgi:hypothetical protein
MGIRDWLFRKRQEPPEAEQVQESVRPAARRVAARAIVLATTVCRAYLEMQRQEIDNDENIENADELREVLLSWPEALGISDELEPQERDLLQTPVGTLEQQNVVKACWRAEGLGVLAWALNRFELPPCDEPNIPPDRSQQSVGWGNPALAAELLKSAVLRPRAEIDKLASHITVVHWRLRQFRLCPVPMDYVGYLRSHPFFKERWLQNLPIIDRDLAIGDKAVADAPADVVRTCESIAVERAIAAYWLRGDDPIYSNVDPSTILSGA